MTGYWASRTPREQGLIGIAALLLAITLVQFAIVKPLRAARAEAALSLEAASRQLDVVSTEIATLRPQTDTGRVAPATSRNVRADLLQLATGRGLSVSRLQTAENGRLILQFERTVPTLVHAWLADAEKTYGLVPERVSMFAEEDGRVRASFEFSGGGS